MKREFRVRLGVLVGDGFAGDVAGLPGYARMEG
jgi:hypothetical protein